MAAKDDKKQPQEKKETVQDILREVYEEDEARATAGDKPKVEAKEEVVEEERDLDEFKEEIKKEAKEEAKAETQDQILKAIGITQEEKDQAEEEGWQTPWEKRGENKPASWQEAVEAGADLADFKRKQEEKEVVKEQEQAEAAKNERREQLNKYWDEQLEELRSLGKLPDFDEKVKEKISKNQPLTEEEREDPGLVAQVNLVGKMNEVAQQRRAEGKTPIYNLKEIYYEHFEGKGNVRAGADAPVSGGRTSVKPSSNEEDDMTYEELHKSDFESLIRNG